MSHAITSKVRATLSPIYLLANGSATGNPQEWPGGDGWFAAEFTGGTSVSLEWKGPDPASSTWYPYNTTTTLAASGGAPFSLPATTLIRAAVTGATGVYATVKQLD